MQRVDVMTVAICLAACAAAAAIIAAYPWFSFLTTILIWTAMRAPKTIGVGHAFNITPARSISDAAYEGLWAAVAIVFGVTIIADSLKAAL